MKRILSIIVLMFTVLAANAQTSEHLQVVNSSNCPVYFKLFISQPVSPGTATCTVNFLSPIISVPALSTVNFIAMTVLGVPPTPSGMIRVFLGAEVHSGPAPCNPPIQPISKYGCMGFPNTDSYEGKNAACQFCGVVNATWSATTINIMNFY